MTCIKGQAMSGQYFKPPTGVVQAWAGPKTTAALSRTAVGRADALCRPKRLSCRFLNVIWWLKFTF